MNDVMFTQDQPDFKVEYFLKEPSIPPEDYSMFLADIVDSISKVCHVYYPNKGLNLISADGKGKEIKGIALEMRFGAVLKFPEILVSRTDSEEVYQRRDKYLYNSNNPIRLQGYGRELNDITDKISSELDRRYPTRSGKLIVSNLRVTDNENPIDIPYDLELNLHIKTVKDIKIEVKLSRGSVCYMSGKPKSEWILVPKISTHVSSILEDDDVISNLNDLINGMVKDTYETSAVLESSSDFWIARRGEKIEDGYFRRVLN